MIRSKASHLIKKDLIVFLLELLQAIVRTTLLHFLLTRLLAESNNIKVFEGQTKRLSKLSEEEAADAYESR